MADTLIENEALSMVIQIAGADMANNASSIAQMSQAISLKRIADAVCGDETHLGLVDAVGNSIYSAIANSKA